MIKLIIILFALFTNHHCTSQIDIKPIVGTSFSFYRTFFGHDLSLVRTELNGGVYMWDHLYFNTNLGFSANMSPLGSERLQIMTNSYSLDYRFLNSDHDFSPLIGLDLGYSFKSNAEGMIINDNMNITIKHQ